MELIKRSTRPVLAAGAWFVLSLPALTQSTVIKWLGDQPYSGLGSSLAILDDVDGDGVRDVASGEPNMFGTGGRVQVLSLRQGNQLAQWQGSFQQFLGSYIARVGDHDGDGGADLMIAGIPEFSTTLDARIVSPQSGATLLVLPPPPGGAATYHNAAGVGDLTGDGIPELVVGWPGAYGRGAVGLIDGQSGALLQELLGDALNDQFGWTVVGLGDVDGDGLGDFAASTFTQVTPGHPPLPAAPGYVRVFSGAAALISGSLSIATLRAPDRAASFGRGSACLGDVDGDGQAELLAIDNYAVHVFRIGSVQPLWSRPFQPYLPGWLPMLTGPVAAGIDLNADGWPDAAISYEDCISPPVAGGCGVGRYVQALSGLDGTRIADIRHPPVAILYGQGLGLVEDLTGDGRGEIVASAPNEGFNDFRGALRITSPVDLPMDPNLDLYSQKGSNTRIQFQLNAGLLHAGQPYLVLGSFKAPFPGIPVGPGLFLPLEPADPWFQYTLANPNNPPLRGSAGLLSSTGTAACGLDLSSANLTPLVGQQAYHSFLVFNAGQIAFISHAAPLSIW
jgi:hypothetical protein